MYFQRQPIRSKSFSEERGWGGGKLSIFITPEPGLEIELKIARAIYQAADLAIPSNDPRAAKCEHSDFLIRFLRVENELVVLAERKLAGSLRPIVSVVMRDNAEK